MRVLSHHAKNHPWTTRLIIILLIYPLLNITGLILGFILNEEGIRFSAWGFYPAALITLALLFTYPFKRKSKKYNYSLRKFYDASLAITTFCFIVLTGNHFSTSPTSHNPANAVHASMQPSSQTIKNPSKQKKKSVKKFLKSLIKKYRNAGDGEKALLIILTILAAIVLIYLLAALSCSIACAGSEALAYLVFILGLGGIVFGVIKIIQSITRKFRKKEPDMQSS